MAILRRVKCVVSYDGTNFNGFQIQKAARSVQEEIQLALFKIHQEAVHITASGRTDSGVHAYGQVFHFDTSLSLDEKEWTRALNANLPEDIHILSSEFVDSSFHARFNAKEKAYIYHLSTGEYNPLRRNYCYQYGRFLDFKRMEEASKLFIGEHDYRNFCSNGLDEVENFVREVKSIEFSIIDDELVITFKGTGFLRYMVRMMVGTLIAIGAHKETKDYILKRLDNKERLVTTYNAPAMGLYLKEVKY